MSPLHTFLTTLPLLLALSTASPLTTTTPHASTPQTLHKWSTTSSPTCATTTFCRPDCVTAFSALCANSTALASTIPQRHTINGCSIYYHNNITTTPNINTTETTNDQHALEKRTESFGEGKTHGKGAESFCLGQFLTIVDPSPRDPRKACNAAKVAGVLTIGEELVYGVFPEGGEMSCFEGDGVEGLIEGVEKEEKNDEVVEAGLEAYV